MINLLEWKELGETLLLEEEPLLTYCLKLPTFTGAKKGEKRLQRYYSRMEQVWLRYFTTELYAQCLQEFREKREKSHLFIPWSLSIVGECVPISEHILSVGLTAQSKRGKEVTQWAFFSELWDSKKGFPLVLEQQEVIASLSEGQCFETLKKVLKQQKDIEFYPNYLERFQDFFSKRKIFFDETGVFAYFDQGTIAVPEEGILKFMLFSENYSCTH